MTLREDLIAAAHAAWHKKDPNAPDSPDEMLVLSPDEFVDAMIDILSKAPMTVILNTLNIGSREGYLHEWGASHRTWKADSFTHRASVKGTPVLVIDTEASDKPVRKPGTESGLQDRHHTNRPKEVEGD